MATKVVNTIVKITEFGDDGDTQIPPIKACLFLKLGFHESNSYLNCQTIFEMVTVILRSGLGSKLLTAQINILIL